MNHTYLITFNSLKGVQNLITIDKGELTAEDNS